MPDLICHSLAGKNNQEPQLSQQEIDAMNVRINAPMYNLHGLTRAEIAAME